MPVFVDSRGSGVKSRVFLVGVGPPASQSHPFFYVQGCEVKRGTSRATTWYYGVRPANSTSPAPRKGKASDPVSYRVSFRADPGLVSETCDGRTLVLLPSQLLT